LLCVAVLGGLLYGVEVGIIGGALPYLEATSHFDAAQLSTIVAAVLLGSVISTIFAGLLADWFGRKPMMFVSGVVFVISIPPIALSLFRHMTCFTGCSQDILYKVRFGFGGVLDVMGSLRRVGSACGVCGSRQPWRVDERALPGV